jgi:diaminohydroxyphosphoribosylaminopyrimidine deaminase/5-amino-6-(5-phosphoribosylamino)uracil reductase
MFTADDHLYMARALRLAARGLYTTDPNPRVGCVLVRDGQVVGEGWHERAGDAHAEINALRQAGERAAGASAYVTLEPCCHHGRTPPCSQALIDAGVTRVVAAMPDPNPLVAGNGLAALEAAGVSTVSGLLAAEAAALNPGFVMRMRHARPWVRCKLAMSLDGRTAMQDGESRWITGEAARRDVHHLRARSSAIMTGIDTVLADDPSLNVRLEWEADVPLLQPLRVIIDSRLRIPPTAKLLDLPGETLILTGSTDAGREALLTRPGVSVDTLPLNAAGQLNLQHVLQYLGSAGINEVHVEAGAVLCGALLADRLVDELVIYVAPHLMGDAARGLFALPGLQHMTQRIALSIQDVRAVGKDLRITARLAD